MPFQIATREFAASGRPTQDRLWIESRSDILRLALADGVGGASGGELAAQFAVDFWRGTNNSGGVSSAFALAEADSLLSQADHGGQTTAIFLQLSGERLEGASVGDSCVWFQEANRRWTELTSGQRTRPFVGSGAAIPIPFSRTPPGAGGLLVASDGLWRSLTIERIQQLLNQHIPLEQIADQLAHSALAPLSKTYLDDCTFALIRWEV